MARRKTSVPQPARTPRRQTERRANRLDGKNWIRNSISVWSDLRKSTAELRLKHPALFPEQLVQRLIESFLPPAGTCVLDPFAGIGSTLVAAARLGLHGIGSELNPEFAQIAFSRLAELSSGTEEPQPAVCRLEQVPASELLGGLEPDSVDLCVTSPPYWNILNQRRTADGKAVRHYGNLPEDLGTIDDYERFLDALADIFRGVLTALKPRAYACVVVMDLRKRNRFYPFHSDLAQRLQGVGFRYDDLIIWNRQSEYNNLRPLGYPAVFRINKVHEYVLLMQKPE